MWKIKKNLINDIIQSSKNYLPEEFLCFLSGNEEKKEINEIVLIPTQNGNDYSSINIYNMPIDKTIIGSLHSHPNGLPIASKADKKFFERFKINIIIGITQVETKINAYDNKSNKINIKIVD
ncbi:MAG: Mov34/MPN/PAD-1 family protein [Candidatus ainarchaeum sp.]|nr:Mov34/MPN/PAD-1 family protein [Candidatus ainarchaeum sp.]